MSSKILSTASIISSSRRRTNLSVSASESSGSPHMSSISLFDVLQEYQYGYSRRNQTRDPDATSVYLPERERSQVGANRHFAARATLVAHTIIMVSSSCVCRHASGRRASSRTVPYFRVPSRLCRQLQALGLGHATSSCNLPKSRMPRRTAGRKDAPSRFEVEWNGVSDCLWLSSRVCRAPWGCHPGTWR